MHISGHGRAQELASLLLGVQEVDRPAPSTAQSARSQGDSVDISQHAKELAEINAHTQKPDAERAERVEQLRQAVDGGTYNVNGRRAADAIIRHVLTESVS